VFGLWDVPTMGSLMVTKGSEPKCYSLVKRIIMKSILGLNNLLQNSAGIFVVNGI
jgi:hypothetical protein